MLQFAWFWILILFPLPLLVRKYLPQRENRMPSVRIPFYRDISTGGITIASLSRASLVLATLAWVLLVVAAARPQWIDAARSIPITGRDLLVAVDISGSMQQADFSVGAGSRFEAVQKIAGDFIQRRTGDRVGLILFGSTPYLYTPLTFDLDTVARFLNESQVGFAGQRTAIGDSIGLAVKVLRERNADNRLLILLTDGENSAGTLDPLQAMELAVKHGVRIFVIGIGPDYTRLQATDGYDSPGVLNLIAEKTGGEYFHASNTRALQTIYETIDRYEPIEADERHRAVATELYPWPLGFGMALLLAVLARYTALQFNLIRFSSFASDADFR